MSLQALFLITVLLSVTLADKWDNFFTERLYQNQSLEWFNEPTHWGLNNGQLFVQPDPETDFWRKTFYDFTHYNGAVLEAKIASNVDWVMLTRVTVDPKNLYALFGLKSVVFFLFPFYYYIFSSSFPFVLFVTLCGSVLRY
jgi:hypothetical protein